MPGYFFARYPAIHFGRSSGAFDLQVKCLFDWLQCENKRIRHFRGGIRELGLKPVFRGFLQVERRNPPEERDIPDIPQDAKFQGIRILLPKPNRKATGFIVFCGLPVSYPGSLHAG